MAVDYAGRRELFFYILGGLFLAFLREFDWLEDRAF